VYDGAGPDEAKIDGLEKRLGPSGPAIADRH
jgi:hypothetical protein